MKKQKLFTSISVTIILGFCLYPMVLLYLENNGFILNNNDEYFIIALASIYFLSILILLSHYSYLNNEIRIMNLIEKSNFSSRYDVLTLLENKHKTIITKKLNTLIKNNKLQSKFDLEDLTNYLLVELKEKSKEISFFSSIFILIGLLGTFYGLIISLSDLKISFESGKMSENVLQTFSGIGLAFGTSITGIFSSLLFRSLLQIYYSKKKSLITTFEHIIQNKIYPILGIGQFDYLGKIFADTLNSFLAKNIKTSIDELNRNVQLLSSNSQKQHESVSKYYEIISGSEKLFKVFGGLTENLNNTLNGIKSKDDKTIEILEAHTESLKSLIEQNKTLLSNSVSINTSLLKTFTDVKVLISENTSNDIKLNQNFEKLLSKIETAIEMNKKLPTDIGVILENYISEQNKSKEFIEKSVSLLNNMQANLQSNSKETLEFSNIIKSTTADIMTNIGLFTKKLDYLTRVLERRQNKNIQYFQKIFDKFSDSFGNANYEPSMYSKNALLEKAKLFLHKLKRIVKKDRK